MVISFSAMVLCAAELRGCLRLWYQFPECSECSGSSGMAQEMVLQGSRLASSVPQQKGPKGRGLMLFLKDVSVIKI